MKRILIWVRQPWSYKQESLNGYLRRFIDKSQILFNYLAKFLIGSRYGRRALYVSYPPNSLLVANSGDEVFVVNSSDRVIGFKTFSDGKSYQSSTLDKMCDLLPARFAKHTFIDIGANIGVIGIHAVNSSRFKQCFAFEPDPLNFRLLKANVLLNDLEHKFSVFNVALSDGTVSSLDFELDEENFGDHRIRNKNMPGLFDEQSRKVISVPAACLDDFGQQIDFSSSVVWMDVQGYEGKILAGASKFLALGSPLVTEFSPYLLQRADCYEQFLDLISNASFSTIVNIETGKLYDCNKNNLQSLATQVGFECAWIDLLVY